MVAGQVKDLREPLYDTYTAAKTTALATNIQFFATRTKDANGIQTTNMTRAGELPAPEAHKVYSIRVEFLNTAEADVLGMLLNYAGRLKVSGTEMCTAPLEFFSAGAGLVTPLATSKAVQNGVADPRATFQIPDGLEIDIEAGNTIVFELISSVGYTLTDANLGIVIRVYLDGIHTVPVG